MKRSELLRLQITVCVLLLALSGAGTLSANVHRVRPGETLWRISRRYGVSLERLKQRNRLRSNSIQPGMVLDIPGSTQKRSMAAELYTVQPGDSAWGISRRYGVTIEQIRRWNNLSSLQLYAGQQLRLEKKQRSAGMETKAGTSHQPVKSVWYRVRKGDSLWLIAKRQRTSVSMIRKMNPSLQGELYPGTLVKLPELSRSVVRTRSVARKKNNTGKKSGYFFTRLPRNSGRYNWPVKGRVVQKTGLRSKGINLGIVIKAPEGRQIYPAAAGTVTFVGSMRGYGLMVMVRHPGNVFTVYSSLNNIKVSKGMRVGRMTVLADTGYLDYAGCYGVLFQMYYKTRPVHPLSYLG